MGIGSRPDPQPFVCLLVLKELNAAVCEGLVGETTVFTYHHRWVKSYVRNGILSNLGQVRTLSILAIHKFLLNLSS